MDDAASTAIGVADDAVSTRAVCVINDLGALVHYAVDDTGSTVKVCARCMVHEHCGLRGLGMHLGAPPVGRLQRGGEGDGPGDALARLERQHRDDLHHEEVEQQTPVLLMVLENPVLSLQAVVGGRCARHEVTAPSRQGLTLVYLSAQRKHFYWDSSGVSVDRWVIPRHKLDTKRLTHENGLG